MKLKIKINNVILTRVLDVNCDMLPDENTLKDLENQVEYYKDFESKYRESEQNLRETQSLARLGNWKIDPITQEISGSEVLLQIFELTATMPTIDDLIDVVYPEDRKTVLKYMNMALELGEPWNIEYRLLMKDGRIKWINTIGKASKNEEGEISMLFGTIQDITDRKEAEAKFTASDSMFRTLVEDSPDFIYVADAEGTVKYINRVYPKHNKSDIIGKKIYEFIDPSYIELTKHQIREVLDNNGSTSVENEAIGPDHLPRFYNSRFVPIKTGEIVDLFFGIVTDITEEKMAAQKLSVSNILLSDAEKIAKLGSFEWDFLEERVLWSDEMFNIFQVPPSENWRKTSYIDSVPNISYIRSLIHPDDLGIFDNSLELLSKGFPTENLEYRIIHPDGEIRDIMTITHLIYTEAGVPLKMVGTVQDITDIKRREGKKPRS